MFNYKPFKALHKYVKGFFITFWFTVIFILTGYSSSFSQVNQLDYIGVLPKKALKPGQDTTRAFDVFLKYYWNITLYNDSGKTREYRTNRWDTIGEPEDFKTVKAIYTSTFHVHPDLLHTINVLHYSLDGSVRIKLNGETLIATGDFADKKKNKLRKLYQDDYLHFVIKDTVLHFDITFIPGSADYDFDLSIGQKKWAEKKIERKVESGQDAFALGFYYLAFGIVFLFLFLFYNVVRENLYFAAFCMMASFSFLIDEIPFELPGNLQGFFFIFSIEFLSMFFAKILINKEKSKIPLLVLLGLAIVTNLPFVEVMLSSHHIGFSANGTGSPFMWALIVFMVLILFYTFFNALYFLIQGFGQKRWEARSIVYICSVATLLFIVNGIIASNANASNLDTINVIVRYLSNIAFCLYPLSAAFVLGKRNGHNQKQLLTLIQSIQKLSEDNLQTEIEKKRILEGQNLQLEKKVLERTREVMLQKEEIEIKNKSITDNMNYAKRIQSAILPNINLIYQSLENSFIIYYPKDIVSGDFYTFAVKNNRTLIIAGDCTGHGVSGAFMSMIGVSLINRLINENGITEPNLILNQLNGAVIETFRQSESESNDGMDVAVCSFDFNNNELHFAGANRPLWIVRDGAILITPPDKYPIGGLQMAADRSFKNNVVKLQKNDTVYIFTDGYADQFGGESGKKMMTAKFKEKLIDIQPLAMKEQEIALKTYFKTWKGDHEQVDDVLVIGIRV